MIDNYQLSPRWEFRFSASWKMFLIGMTYEKDMGIHCYLGPFGFHLDRYP